MRTFIGMVLLLAVAGLTDQIMLNGRYTNQGVAEAKTFGRHLNTQFNKFASKLKF